MKKQKESLQFNFEEIGKSKIAIWHRPTKKHIKELKTLGFSMIITVQSQKECPKDISDECKNNNLKFFHVPLDGANMTLLNQKETISMLQEKLQNINQIFHSQEETALIHCAAGIHRTGIFTYSILRLQGNNKEQAMDKILKLREDTHKGVGDHRIELADNLILTENIFQTNNQTQ